MHALARVINARVGHEDVTMPNILRAIQTAVAGAVMAGGVPPQMMMQGYPPGAYPPGAYPPGAFPPPGAGGFPGYQGGGGGGGYPSEGYPGGGYPGGPVPTYGAMGEAPPGYGGSGGYAPVGPGSPAGPVPPPPVAASWFPAAFRSACGMVVAAMDKAR